MARRRAPRAPARRALGARLGSFSRPGRLVPPTAQALRAGAVQLRRGEVMPWHSTGAREELLIALKGRVQIRTEDARGGARRLVLRAGRCAFLPTKTRHLVMNVSRRTASYLYVTGPLPGRRGAAD